MNTVVITIEAASEMDYESWLPLWKNYQIFYNVDIPDAVTTRTWERFANPIEPIFCAVAKSNGEVVGFAHYLFHRSTWAESDYC